MTPALHGRRILVTGSAGFIGRYVVSQLAKDGALIVGLDIKECPTGAPAAYRHERVDLLDAAASDRVIWEFRPEGVIHLAARTDLDETATLEDYAVNHRGVRNLLESVRAVGSVERLVCASSQLVCRMGYTPSADDDYAPSTVYGASKVETERICRELDGGGATWSLARPTTVWGAGMNAHYRRFFRLLERGMYFHVGGRPAVKSFGYVRNVALELARILSAPAELVHRKVLYVCDYQPVELRDWVEAFRRELGGPPVPTVPGPAAKAIAWVGDSLEMMHARFFPFNSFRLRNMTTPSTVPTDGISRIVGPLPVDLASGVREAVALMRAGREDVFPPLPSW